MTDDGTVLERREHLGDRKANAFAHVPLGCAKEGNAVAMELLTLATQS